MIDLTRTANLLKVTFCHGNIFFFSSNDTSAAEQQPESSSGVDFRSSKLEQYIKVFPWLYYNHLDKGYKCKTCEMFPPLDAAGPNKFKFGQQAVKLTDHPTHNLKVHQQSKKHESATKQYKGIVLTFYFAILPASRNETVDFQGKSTVWFLPAGSNAR